MCFAQSLLERKFNHEKTFDNVGSVGYGIHLYPLCARVYYHPEIHLFGLPNNLHPSRTSWAMV